MKEEQADDDKQKAFCSAELEKAADDKASEEGDVKEGKTSADELKQQVETVDSEIQTLKDGIAALDNSVADATDARKKEHALFSSTVSANQAAMELLEMAKNR